MRIDLPSTPGALLGYRKNGQPIYLIGGGSQPHGEPAPGAQAAPAGQPAQPSTAPPAFVAPPFQPSGQQQPTPTPAAPAAPAQGQAQQPAAPAQTGQQAQQQAEDLASLPDWAQKIIRDARAEAASTRVNAKQTAADEARRQTLAQVAQALGIQTGDTPPTTEQLTGQIEQAQAAAWRSATELQVHRMAGQLGADPDRLLDSLSFIESLDDLVDVDPASADFRTALEAKVRDAVGKNPSYKAAPAQPAAVRSGGALPGGPGTAPQRPRGLGAAIRQAMGQ